jgi:NAD(P)-dependent dehydrogenase (short-subunit alcohol dehydrogenase family)
MDLGQHGAVGPEAMFRLDGRVVVLTGGSSGLGWRFAHVLHAAGARLVVAARRSELLDALGAELPGVVTVRADITDPDDRGKIVDTALELGPIDVLVNNAGSVAPAKAIAEPIDAFREVIEVNLVATFALCQLVATHMLDRGRGAIVNVSSILGLVGNQRVPLASYAASKGGLVNLTRELAAQWAAGGVRVNSLAPGWFYSEMTASLLASRSGRRFVEESTPMGRPGDEHELDGALLFLASDASTFVTGQVLAVDGGWTAL